MAIAPEQVQRIGIRRHFTTPDQHPYDTLEWETREARIPDLKSGGDAFFQPNVEFPVTWSQNATNIVAQKYFRGPLGAPEREYSVRQIIDRVADTITDWGMRDGYFVDSEEAETFRAELKYVLVHQRAAFNSPVWFNIGVSGEPQQASACQPYDALVSTPEGLIPIGKLVEDNAVGTKVYDAQGITRIVATKHNGVKPVLRVHAKAGYVLDVTADHLVWRPRRGWVPAGDLRPGDQLAWHRVEQWGEGDVSVRQVREAALAGWLQSDGFVGQYDGTNRSLTIEAMTVTEMEYQWVLDAIEAAFPDVHRHERSVVTQDKTLDCRRIRLYGNVLSEFVERWGLRARGIDMTVPDELFTAPLPVVAAYLRSLFQAEGYVSIREHSAKVAFDMISEGIVRGAQRLLSRFGIFARVRFKPDRRNDRHGCWSLTIQPLPDRVRFAAEIGFVDPAKSEKLERSLEMAGICDRDTKALEIDHVETLGRLDVYDVQTESGEYLSSGGLRVHNCFILDVDDTMDSILNWYREEGIIFKGGSGSGVNLSKIRSSKEPLKGGGTASGPVSFMRGADASAGTIKSGGKTRRAAKMAILNVDHPDVREFVWCKALEERKARALRGAGFDMDLDGRDSHSIQYQNANNSVRVTDEFMRAVEEDADWDLKAVTTAETAETVKARELMREIAAAAWECADPGVQYDTTINRWNTAANTARINASNPCCFVGDTLVSAVDGPISLERLHKMHEAGEELPSVHAARVDGTSCEATVSAIWIAGETRALVDVATTGGLRLRCTPEHRFLVADGTYVEAQDLSPGRVLRSLTDAGVAREDRVEYVTPVMLDEPVPVYDLESLPTHSFVVTSSTAVEHGVVVHNSEYMHLDNSACNLASINLLKYLREDGSFDVEGYRQTVEVVFTAQEILVGNADYPTEKIGENARKFRQLGLGYANLGALLMARGLPYDSDEGRAWAGALTALMTGHAYATSARTASRMGPFAGYAENRQPMLKVLDQHRAACADVDEELVPADVLDAARKSWDDACELGEQFGVRNSQATVQAPTGTISFLMDCDTTGIEPDLALTKHKKLVGGGTMEIVNRTVPRALRTLGYDDAQVDEIVSYVDDHKTIVGAPALRDEHLPVFATAMGDNVIHHRGHINMMAAIQPFISGALSKTVNVPETTTVEEIEDLYLESWKLGLKAVAIYRDNCKVAQPLATQKKAVAAVDAGTVAPQVERVVETVIIQQPVRQKLQKTRNSKTFSFRVADCKGYCTVGEFEDGRPGELFLKVAKQGSTLAGIMDSFAIGVSLGLQYGVPLKAFVEKYTSTRFEPAGMTDDKEIRFASSLVDYIFRRLAVEYMEYEERAELGIHTVAERTQPTLPGVEEAVTPMHPADFRHPELDFEPTRDEGGDSSTPELPPSAPTAPARMVIDAPICAGCGAQMRPSGSCYVCTGCGSTSGCS